MSTHEYLYTANCKTCSTPIAQCNKCLIENCPGWFHTQLPGPSDDDGHKAVPS